MRFYCRCLVLFCSTFTAQHTAAGSAANVVVTEVRIPNYQPGTGDFYFYIKNLLSLALAQSDNRFGPVVLKPNSKLTNQTEQFRNLTLGVTNITWSITTEEREKKYIPIRVPLTAGLFGYRVLLQRQSDHRFDTVLPMEQLKSMTAIQGEGWPDNEVLSFNGFTLITSDYSQAFTQLKDGNADYFPRAAHEIFGELALHADDGFAVEQHIALRYHNPMFFFVALDHPLLAKRLQLGLDILAKNGDLNRLLTAQHFYIQARDLLAGRELYPLQNPLLSDKTQQAIEKYNSPLSRLF